VVVITTMPAKKSATAISVEELPQAESR